MGLRRWAGIGILTVAAAVPAAQWTFGADSDPTCPQIVHAALDATARYCEGTGRNKVCYGNVRVEAEPRPDLPDFVFAERGDTVDVADIESVRTSPMNPRTGEWGVALMRLQALRGRGTNANLTVVLMGDAELQQPQPLGAAQFGANSNSPTAAAQGPMYAFAFRSAQNDAQCAEVPESGMLIQTPEGVAEVTLLINEVDVQLGSTVYFQAVPNRALKVYVLEGHADVTAQGATESIPAGATASVPLNQDSQPSGPPTDAKPYEPEEVANAPLPLLERPVEIAPPADDGDEVVESSIETLTPTTAVTLDAATSTATATPTEEATATPEEIASPTPADPPTVTPTEYPAPTLEASPDPVAQAVNDEPTATPTDETGKDKDKGKEKDKGREDRAPTPSFPPGLGLPQVTPSPTWWYIWLTTPTPTPFCALLCPTPPP